MAEGSSVNRRKRPGLLWALVFAIITSETGHYLYNVRIKFESFFLEGGSRRRALHFQMVTLKTGIRKTQLLARTCLKQISRVR